MIKDSQSEYFTDERSGSDQEDSDREFDAIVALDHLLKQVEEHKVGGDPREYHANILALVEQVAKLGDLIEFDQLKECFDTKIAPEIIEISNFGKLVTLANHCYQARLPYEKVWASLVNVVLLLHAEMSEKELIDLLWFVCKSVRSPDLLSLDLSLVKAANPSRLLKKAQLTVLTEYLRDIEVTQENVLKMSFLFSFFSIEFTHAELLG